MNWLTGEPYVARPQIVINHRDLNLAKVDAVWLVGGLFRNGRLGDMRTKDLRRIQIEKSLCQANNNDTTNYDLLMFFWTPKRYYSISHLSGVRVFVGYKILYVCAAIYSTSLVSLSTQDPNLQYISKN